MANFKESLQTGKEIEEEICKIIKHKYPSAYVKDGYYKQGDIIIPEVNQLVEVKRDYQSKYTGNFLVEIEYDGKPSALSTTQSDWWVIVDQNYYYLVNPDALKHIIQEANLKIANFTGKGDTKPKKAYLVPKSKLTNSPYVSIYPRNTS